MINLVPYCFKMTILQGAGEWDLHTVVLPVNNLFSFFFEAAFRPVGSSSGECGGERRDFLVEAAIKSGRYRLLVSKQHGKRTQDGSHESVYDGSTPETPRMFLKYNVDMTAFKTIWCLIIY